MDLGDVSLLPGLIEAHSHIPCPPRVDRVRDHHQRARAERGLMRATAAVATALRSGVTTMRDLGARNDVVFPIRDAIADGVIAGPRLLASGAPITRTHDHCWFWGGEADSADDVAAIARRQVEAGADVIKVMASGGNFTPSSSPRARQYPPEVLATIVEAASAAETASAAGIRCSLPPRHTHAAATVCARSRCREAGVRHLIHCRWLSADPEGGYEYDCRIPRPRRGNRFDRAGQGRRPRRLPRRPRRQHPPPDRPDPRHPSWAAGCRADQRTRRPNRRMDRIRFGRGT